MSWFPFVPRSTYDAAISQRDERIAELKIRLAKMEEDHEKFVDILGGRAIGQTVYGRIVPPKLEEEEPESGEPAKDPGSLRIPTPLESDISEIGTRARGLARRAEQRSMAEIEEAERALELARSVGRERAELAANGNGNH